MPSPEDRKQGHNDFLNTLGDRAGERKEEKAGSLREVAEILGISPTYLSLLLNGKRPWRGNLKDRYKELVNSTVNTEGKASDENTGAQGGIRTHTPDKGKRILSPLRLPFRHLGTGSVSPGAGCWALCIC